MRNGAVVETGPTRSVIGAPEAAYTRRLIAALPSLTPPRTPLPVFDGDAT
jgi:peptide/nickel transport system ATP-binding protein